MTTGREIAADLSTVLPSLWTAIATVILLLGVVIWSGVTGRRILHYIVVIAMLGALYRAITKAEIVGELLVFEGLSKTLLQVHFVFVAADFILIPLVAWSGIRLARAPENQSGIARMRHGKAAKVLVISLVTTCILGSAMTLLATPASP